MTEAIHRLKTWPEYFIALDDHKKEFEVRKNDRNFAVGDILHLCEWDPDHQNYTGRDLFKLVIYVLPGGQFGIEPGYVVMSLADY